MQSQYDALDRLSWMNDGTRSNSYDANGNVTHMSVAASEQSGTALAATYGYDGGNRLTSLLDNVGPGGTQLHSYAYTYDGSGNRKTIAEDGTTTTYTYDGDNQLTTITDSAGTTTLASYSYDAHHNRATMVTSAGTTSYAYDTAGVELTQVTDPNNAVTQYIYDQQTGNLTQKVRNPGGGSLATTYKYVSAGYLSEVDMPDGSKVQYVYDGLGQRLSKSLTSGGTTPTTTVVNDVYEGGLIAYEASANGTLLAAFTYDGDGSPTSVQVGADVTTAPRYYYIYNGHGDVVALVDGSGNRVAEYGYDAFGVPTEVTESFTNGWTNPYRYDGRDRVRYDAETGLYWMNARAYDPTLGRFISRDTWSHAPMVEALVDPYVYAANNPLVNVDPSGHQWSRAAVTGNTSHPGMPRAGLFKCGTWTFALHLTNPLRLGAIGMIGGCNKPVIVANATMSLYRGYDFLGMIFWIRDSFWHACAYHGIIENEWKFCPDFQKDKVSTWTKPVNPGELWAVKTVWTAISAEQDAGTATNFASVRF